MPDTLCMKNRASYIHDARCCVEAMALWWWYTLLNSSCTGLEVSTGEWSMSLQWRKSPKSVRLFALRRTSFHEVASGYTSSILVLKRVTRAGMIRFLQRLLAVIRLPTCASYTLHDNTDIHQFVAIIQPTAAFYWCIHCYECKTRDRGTPYTLDNRFQVNRQSIRCYSNRKPIVACDRYRLALFEACGQQ